MKQDFLHITDFDAGTIYSVLDLAARLKADTRAGKEHPLLKGKTLAMIFQKPSARTRISFETGMSQLGGHALYLGPSDIGMGEREETKDVARVVSRYNDLIMARVFGHITIIDLARWASVPVINGLSDYNHPCQVMADIFTIKEHRHNLDDLKVAYVGDGNNVANSWLNLSRRIPMTLTLACPQGYDPDEKTLASARESGTSEIFLVRDPLEAVPGADVVYTDVWISMGQESDTNRREKAFRSFQVTEELMSAAGDQARFMHCLPAHRGEEVTDAVLEGKDSIVFDQAENRLHVQKAITVILAGSGD
ncbi:MAG: ornithine carbamoyltransferase [Fidelibacterota bacterium]